ncbi:MAG: hypothetical protein ACLQKA_01760 [Bryobacteraceae bacterium]
MNQLRGQILARTGFSTDEYAAIGGGETGQLRPKTIHRLACTHNAGEVVSRERRGVGSGEAIRQRCTDGGYDIRQRVGLLQKIGYARTQRLE